MTSKYDVRVSKILKYFLCRHWRKLSLFVLSKRIQLTHQRSLGGDMVLFSYYFFYNDRIFDSSEGRKPQLAPVLVKL